MRILQHSLFLAVPVLAFSITAFSQTKVSDVKLEGLKGPVKSVVQTGKAVSGYAEWVLKDTTKYQTTYHYNRDGELTQTISENDSITKYVYSKVDGYKTFKSIELKKSERFAGKWGSVEKEKPIEPDEKLTEPDTRYDFKYVYETDGSGRVIAERQYGNDGKLFRKKSFTYDSNGVLTKEREEDTAAVMTYAYKSDDKGNVIEVHKTRDIKGAGSDSKERITYTEMKFDAMGNWIERKSTRYSETEGMPQYNLPPEKYTLVDFATRTIIYY